MPSFIQWAKLESLLSRFWTQGLMFDAYMFYKFNDSLLTITAG